AVQIAKAQGAYVIGTASASNHAFLRELGADEVVDYSSVDFASVVREVDVVLDGVGGDYGLRSLAVLRRGGVLVTLPSPDDLPPASATAAAGVRAVWNVVEPDSAGLQAVARLVASGALRATADQVLPLSEAAKAHQLGERGRIRGKVVLSVA
ncbi:zinc-binding dehydrogenase, partial [Streptomyces sp. T-3]|nr:zinc-binding dehydrogenase [Streptomyces sp. T-3]